MRQMSQIWPGTAYPSITPEYIPVFSVVRVVQSLVYGVVL